MRNIGISTCYTNHNPVFRSGNALRFKRHQDQSQDSLLVKRRNENHSPGPVIRELVPNSHQRSELSNKILCIFSGWDQRIGEGIPIPDSNSTSLRNRNVWMFPWFTYWCFLFRKDYSLSNLGRHFPMLCETQIQYFNVELFLCPKNNYPLFFNSITVFNIQYQNVLGFV